MSQHTGTCATAMRPGCSCVCLHARHGLDGRLRWAVALAGHPALGDADVPVRDEALRRQKLARDRLDDRIAKARKSKRSRRMSAVNTTAATEYARTVNLVQWLVEHPTERDHLHTLVDTLVTASTDLLASVPPSRRDAMKNRILDHLWCDLIASVVCAIEQFESLEKTAKAKVAAAIAHAATGFLAEARASADASPSSKNKDGSFKTKAELDQDAGLSLDSAIIQGCIRGVVTVALDGATAGLDAYFAIILVKLRTAGVMLCPDIAAHDRVWQHCWLPLWKDALFDEVLESLSDLVDGLKPDPQFAARTLLA